MDPDRLRWFHPFASTMGPVASAPGWAVEIDLRDRPAGPGRLNRSGPAALSVAGTCPGCERPLVVGDIDLVNRVATLTCPGCGLQRARWLPAS